MSEDFLDLLPIVLGVATAVAVATATYLWMMS